ncbi:MAG: type II toxin-antitoxin system RelB/DinJ family antitoxin [bacterium]|nr:type II toxin-antitoxin system RelB/DinJ family antitoxin [bacterium]
MATIQVRIDERVKRSANRVLDALGLDMSTAVKLFLRQVSLRKGIPFRLLTENGLTVEEESAILRASREAKRGKNVSRVMSPKEAVKYLQSV